MVAKAPKRVINSVDRAVTILKLFLRERPEWSLSEISHRLPLHKSTAHFLLATLVSHGLLSQDPATRRYRLGLLAFEFALKGNGILGLRDAARPLLERLSASSRETCSSDARSAMSSTRWLCAKRPAWARATSRAASRRTCPRK